MLQICNLVNEFYSLEKLSKISQDLLYLEQFCGSGFKSSPLKTQYSLSINNLWKEVKIDTLEELQRFHLGNALAGWPSEANS